jgi:nitroreductase
MDTYLTIVSKRDQRSYAEQPVPDEVLDRVLEAGRLTGNAKNLQERRFGVLTDETRARAASLVTRPTNLERAATAIAIITGTGRWSDFDAGRAAQAMMLAAWDSGVGSCPNSIAEQEAAAELLGAAGEERVLTILSFGYPPGGHDPSSRSEDEWRARADRLPRDSVVREL